MSNIASKILVPVGFSEQSMVAMGQAFNLAKIAFQQRRKTIKKSLAGEIINFDQLSDIGINEKSRAEELNPGQYLLMANMVSNEN